MAALLAVVEEPDVAAVDGRRGDPVHPAAEGGEGALQVEAERVRHGVGVETLKEKICKNWNYTYGL